MARPRTAGWVVLALAAVALLALAPSADAEAFGSPREHRMATPMLDGGAVWTGDEVVLLGGRNGSGPQDAIQSFDPAAGEAKLLSARLPNDTQAAGVSWTGQQAYLFGGAGLKVTQEEVEVDGEVRNVSRIEVDPHDQIVRYDPVTQHAVRTEATLPDEVFALAAAHVGDATYIFGGVNRTTDEDGAVRANNKDWILQYNPEADTVERVTSLPVPLRDAEVAVHDGDVYVFGGIAQHGEGDDRTFEPSDAVYRFDPGTHVVTKLDVTLDHPMRWFSVATVEDRAYLFGGCADGCDTPAEDQLKTVYRFNFTTRELTQLHPTLTWGPSIATMAVHDGDDVWVLGGGRGPDRYDVVYDNATRFVPGPTPPSAPRNLSAAPTQAGVDLAWEPPVDDGGWGLEAYAVERAKPGAAHRRIATLGPDVTSWTDDGATPGVNHTYRIRAVGPGGTGPPSAVDNATAPTRPPGAPQRLEAAGLPDRILVRWDAPASDGGEDIDEYRVYRNGSLLGTTTDLSFPDGDVRDNVTYTYEVSAVNVEGEGLAAGPVNGTPRDRLPPPQAFQVTAGSRIDLNWEAPETGSPDAYEVLRGPMWDDLSVLAAVQGTNHVDETAQEGIRYWYAVAAVSGNESGLSTKAQQAVLLVAPGQPTNLTADARPGEVVLRWDPPRDAGGADDVYYDVIRSTGNDSGEDLSPRFWDEPSWIDEEVREDETYTYSVEAVTAGGRSERAGPLTVHVPVENTPPEARLSASTLRAEVGEVVTFDASGSSDEQGPVVEARFHLGDGTDTGWSPRLDVDHAYGAPGTYNVTVRVRDEAGAASPPATALVSVTEVQEPADGNGTDGPDDGDQSEPPADEGEGFPVPGPGPAAAALAGAAASLIGSRRRGSGGRSRGSGGRGEGRGRDGEG